MSQPSSDDAMFAEAAPEEFQEAPEFQAPVQYRKPTFNIYSMMMLLSFLFTTAAAIILVTNIK